MFISPQCSTYLFRPTIDNDNYKYFMCHSFFLLIHFIILIIIFQSPGQFAFRYWLNHSVIVRVAIYKTNHEYGQWESQKHQIDPKKFKKNERRKFVSKIKSYNYVSSQ